MATLVVTFTRGRSLKTLGEDTTLFPVMLGAAVRTEVIDIGESEIHGGIVAAADEHYVVLKAYADCWVVIGPDSEAGIVPGFDSSPPDEGNVWRMDNGERLVLAVAAGDMVGTIQAA